MFFALSSWGQIAESDETAHSSDAIRLHVHELTDVCNIGMSNIMQELEVLAGQYPPLNALGPKSMLIGNASDSNLPLLSYSKNMHFASDRYDPALQGLVVSKGDVPVIDEGGMVLVIGIQNTEQPLHAIFAGRGLFIPLVVQGERPKWQVFYNLALHKADPPLENAVKSIVELQADILKRRFQDIIRTDAAAERANACGPVMTNVFRALQALGKQCPLLTNMGSSVVIENKGPGYAYNHLRYWRNVNADARTNPVPFQPQPIGDLRALAHGALALDVYLLNADEPFGFIPHSGYPVYSVEGNPKIELVYILNCSREDQSSDPEQVRATFNAVAGVIEKQAHVLKTAIDGILEVPIVK
jgi:hypothetical protein